MIDKMRGHVMAKDYKTKYSYAKKKNGMDWSRFFQLLPIYLTLGFLPFLIRVHIYEHQLTQFPWYYANTGEYFADTFLVYRQWCFTGIAFYMFFVLLAKFLHDKKALRYSATCIPIGVFALFSLISAVFSEYPGFSFGGIFEQFENVFVLMGYALMVYYVFLIVESEDEVRRVLYVLTFSTMALGLIGTLQTFGIDMFESEFIKSLIIPAGLEADIETSGTNETAVMTLYNPNYVGVYVAMLFPLYAVLLLFSKQWKERLAYTLTLLFLLISLYGSGSKAAFLVIMVELLILLVFMRRPILKFWYLVIPAATALVAVFLLVNQARDNVYIDRIQQALKLRKTEYALQSIETAADGVHFVYNGNELIATFSKTGEGTYTFDFRDSTGERLAAAPKENGLAYDIEDPRFEGFEANIVLYDGVVCFGVVIDGHTWRFTNQYDDSGMYYYLTEKGKFDQLHMAEQVLFGDYERILSGRGYIWSVSIPLLKKHFVLGSGADTFVITFPQQDYLRLWRNGFSEQIMSKPHSLYLQVGVQNGVIALLGMMAFFVMYLLQSVHLYINSRFESFYEQAGVAVMLAVLGFAVMGISNDSSVTVSPIFWAIAGLGVYLNSQSARLRKERESATE